MSTTTEQEDKAHSVELDSGTTVSLQHVEGEEWRVILGAPDAPADLRDYEAGRVIGGGFQPAPFMPAALSAETLRTIAQLIEDATAGREALGLSLSMQRVEDGLSIPVEVEVTYPRGMGISAAVALTANPDRVFSMMARALLARGDESALDTLALAKVEAEAEAEAEAAETEEKEA